MTPAGDARLRYVICLYADIYGIVRHTETIPTESVAEATAQALAFLDSQAAYDSVQLWENGELLTRLVRDDAVTR
jgi:hypothetical protein